MLLYVISAQVVLTSMHFNFKHIKRHHWWLLLLATLPVLALLFLTPSSLNHSAGYAHIYDRAVASFHTSGAFGGERFLAPGVPLVLGLLSFVGPLWPDNIRLFQTVLLLALSLLTFLFARNAFESKSVGIVAAFLMAWSPLVLLQFFSYGPDLLYAVSLLIGLVFSLRIVRAKGSMVVNALGGGSALGFAALTDPVGLYVPLIVAVWMVIALKKVSYKRRALVFVLFLGMSLAVIAPWYVRNIYVFGVSEAPVVQKVIEREVVTNLRTTQLILYPFINKPSVVLEKMFSMFFIPPDLDFLDKNTEVHYRDVAKSLVFEGTIPESKELRILGVKSVFLITHIILMLLSAVGLYLQRRNPVAWLTILLLGYTSFSVIGYASLSLFRGVSPFNEFIIPLYAALYSFAAFTLVQLYRWYQVRKSKG